MDPREKLNAIQQQKHRLRARIDELNSSEVQQQANDPELERLLQKKKAVCCPILSWRKKDSNKRSTASSRRSTTNDAGRWKGRSS